MMLELSHLAINSPVSYAVALLLPAFDAIIPVLPSETAIITLGVATAGSTDPRIAILVALAALGAFIGDNINYMIGHRLGPAIDRRVFASEKGRRRRAWAEDALNHYGARIIIVCRFIPGGRTAVTLVCGLVEYRRRTFVAATACAGVIWACYAFFLGRLGGQAFQDRPWVGLVLAFSVALVITGLTEVVRRLRPWRWFSRGAPGQRAEPAEPTGPAQPTAPTEPAEPTGPAGHGGDPDRVSTSSADHPDT
jgi:membrane-associated protein